MAVLGLDDALVAVVAAVVVTTMTAEAAVGVAFLVAVVVERIGDDNIQMGLDCHDDGCDGDGGGDDGHCCHCHCCCYLCYCSFVVLYRLCVVCVKQKIDGQTGVGLSCCVLLFFAFFFCFYYFPITEKRVRFHKLIG